MLILSFIFLTNIENYKIIFYILFHNIDWTNYSNILRFWISLTAKLELLYLFLEILKEKLK